jgi:PDZ domain
MSAPRHLWSGDWRDESSAHADELAARRAAQPEQPIQDPPAAAPSRVRRSAAERLRAWLRATRRRPRLHLGRRYAGRRRVRIAALVGLAALVVAGAAYGVTSALSGSGGTNQGAANGFQPWVGIELYNSPFGGPIVVGVVSGGPAQAAGVHAGDVINQVDGRRVATTSEFGSAIAGKHAGDQITIRFERGAVTYVAHVTLARRPVAYP